MTSHDVTHLWHSSGVLLFHSLVSLFQNSVVVDVFFSPSLRWSSLDYPWFCRFKYELSLAGRFKILIPSSSRNFLTRLSVWHGSLYLACIQFDVWSGDALKERTACCWRKFWYTLALSWCSNPWRFLFRILQTSRHTLKQVFGLWTSCHLSTWHALQQMQV